MKILKAVVLGDSEVGKTSFTQRWTQGTFPDPSLLKTTVGASFDTLSTELSNGECITLSVWDFGGQKRFIEQLKGMIRGAKIGLFFFDTSHLQSLDNLYNYWVPITEEHGNFSFINGDGNKFLLVGNKIDLIHEPFDQVVDEMTRFCDKFGTTPVLISAKTGVGLEHLDMQFKKICEAVL